MQTVAIVEHVDDGSAALSNHNSDSRAAAASDSESTVLLQYSTTSAAANDDNVNNDDDKDDEMIVVRKETMTSAESPHKVANGSATALENGTAHGAATGEFQGDAQRGDELDSSGATNAHLPREVQVVSAVSGKKMSLAEARAEFFKNSA